MNTKLFPMNQAIMLTLLAVFILLSGCTTTSSSSNDDEMAPSITDQPFYSADFKEVLIPGGLKLNRDKSMFITTNSFKGGFLHYKGRLEVSSLTDFFLNSMPKNGWQRTGMAKYKYVLLAFSKPGKTCMITITESDLKFSTEVYIYVSEQLNNSPSPSLTGQEQPL